MIVSVGFHPIDFVPGMFISGNKEGVYKRKNMTIQSALREGQSILFYAEVETPMLDSTVLLADVLGISRETLFASLTEYIDDGAFHTYMEFIDKRCRGIPVSYIRCKKEFYGLDFYVDERVFVPRPDTETLVDVVLDILNRYPDITTLHDVCTGSGCIAITLKHYKPGLLVTASDISRDAGLVFRINSRNLLNSEIPFYCSDLLGGITGKFDIITANPPYLSDKEVDDMKKIGWPEPELALRGEGIGTTVSILLISLAKLFLNPGGFLVMEFTPEHKYELYSTMVALGYRSISVEKDLGKRDRVISGRMPWGK